MVGMAPLHSYLIDSRIGGQGRNNHATVGQFLTREQTGYIYRKVQTGEVINTNMIGQEIKTRKTSE